MPQEDTEEANGVIMLEDIQEDTEHIMVMLERNTDSSTELQEE